jgi:ribosome-associated toxin RatA of RatAB toxin-antitoxin module
VLLQYLFRRFFKVPRKINFLKSVDEDFSKVYDQIANFENYSLFIPGCTKSELIEKQDKFEIGKLDFDF